MMPELKKIPVRTIEGIRKDTSKYIYVTKQGNAICERCNHEFTLPKTRHLQEQKCPKCKKKMTIVHDWRRKNEIRTDWRMVATVLDSNSIVFRYVIVERNDMRIVRIKEVARMEINFALDTYHCYEFPYYAKENEWEVSKRNFFAEFNMSTYRSNLCCLQAKIYNARAFINELRKIENFKYLDFTDLLFLDGWYKSELIWWIYDKSLAYEQLQKAGYTDFVISDIQDRAYYNKAFTYDPTQKTLAKKLGLTEIDFKRLKADQTLKTYNMLKAVPNATDKEFEDCKFFGWESYVKLVDLCNFYHIKKGKTLGYIKKNVLTKNLRVSDYVDYIQMMDKMNYPIDNQYSYPKDFIKAKEMIVERFNELRRKRLSMSAKELALDEAKKDETIYRISKVLNESKELRQWFKGADGLKVFVPESVGELVDSGIHLHNCLGNYADLIANNESLIFFIRRIEAPDEDYIAMEYKYGKVEQLRLDNNQPVVDAKIIDFATSLARKLNEINMHDTITTQVIRKVA